MPAHSHRISGSSFASPTNAPHRVAAGVAVVVAAFVISALVNRFVARRAERNNPPTGKFVEVGALRLHYTEQGQGPPLVLLHGNSGMIQDFTSSGLIDKAVKRYRVIVFDRPGFGHSNRPRRTIWTPEAQADFLHEALERIGVSRATVLGHSWGASVAVTMALKYPAFVGALVLASGYFYPTFRSDVVFLSGPSFPGIGDIMSHTISPILGRIMRPAFLRKVFGPAPVPRKFGEFPKEMALRPSQIRASAAETALMIPDAFALCKRYADLRMPVVIIAGEQDRLIDIDKQSARLHRRHAKHSASSARRRSYGASNSNGRGNGGNRRSCGCNIRALGDKGEAASSLNNGRSEGSEGYSSNPRTGPGSAPPSSSTDQFGNGSSCRRMAMASTG